MVAQLFTRQAPPPLPPPPPQAYLEETYAPQMLAVNGSLFGLALLCVLLRIYTRTFMLKTFGIDDWIMVFSALMSSICFGLFVTLTSIGVGHHAEYFLYVRPDKMTIFFQITWTYAWILTIAYSAIKISIACFLLRLADHRRYWRWVLYTIIVVLVLFTIGSVLSIMLQCIPVRAAWDFNLRAPQGNATCLSNTTFRNVGVFNSVFNLVTDLLLAILPVPMIWRLQTNRRIRFWLCIILGLGLFACGVAVYKIPIQFHFFEETDFSGKGAWYYIWQQVEMNVGIIAACLPTLKPLAANFLGAVSALTTGERYGSRYGPDGGSRPYASNGYWKQPERIAGDSFALTEIKSSNANSELNSPYKLDHEDGTAMYRVHGMRVSRTLERDSDESVAPLRKGILKTTEVDIS